MNIIAIRQSDTARRRSPKGLRVGGLLSSLAFLRPLRRTALPHPMPTHAASQPHNRRSHRPESKKPVENARQRLW
jgi:hypothetical protein